MVWQMSVDHDTRCFPGGHRYPLDVLIQSSQSSQCLQSILIWLVIDRCVDNTET